MEFRQPSTCSSLMGEGNEGLLGEVWGLPFDLMNLEAGKDISGGIGKVLDVDCKATDSNQAQFLRVRVEVPLNKLYRGVLLSLTLKQIRCGLPSNMSGYKVYVSTLED
ncbi:hypothetical protein CFP56_040979 [Quercus suber]|uniref:Uncharacterized protein n=1 Tax=Quercus suber TaxID=58331 RepID=A0AAW0LJX7_QUESU